MDASTLVDIPEYRVSAMLVFAHCLYQHAIPHSGNRRKVRPNVCCRAIIRRRLCGVLAPISTSRARLSESTNDEIQRIREIESRSLTFISNTALARRSRSAAISDGVLGIVGGVFSASCNSFLRSGVRPSCSTSPFARRRVKSTRSL